MTISKEQYETYLKDQINDSIFPEERREIGKAWSYEYCEYLTKSLLKNFDYRVSNILDVGCREFFTFDYFNENYENKITGIDINTKGLEYTRENNKFAVDLDAHVMDEYFDEDSYDLIMSIHALEHMIDMPKVLKNCYKLLRNGGYLYFAIPLPSRNSRRGHWMDIRHEGVMHDFLKESGFVLVYSEVFGNKKFRPETDMVGLYQKVGESQ